MARTYTSTIDVRCWKEHSCVGCGTPYAYELARKAVGTSPTPEQATTNARYVAARMLRESIDTLPCPTCGLYQPDMVAQGRAQSATRSFWFALVALVAVLFLRLIHKVQTNTATWLAVAICLAAAIVLARAELKNLNSNTERNRQRGSNLVESGRMRALVRAPTKADRKHARPSRSAFGWMALVLLPGAVMAAVAPEMLRVAFGWPLNHACYPPVVGPGDTTRIYTRQKIHSVKGYWRAQPEVVIAARREGGEPWLIPASGETNQNDWGSSITVSSGAKSQVSSPWVEVSLPTENSLGGQEVRCDIHLQVEYPQIDGYSTFHDETRSIDYSVPLALAPARAGMIYNGFWWLSTLFSVGTISAAALLIGRGARSLKRMANPTRVYALDRERETMSDPIPNQGSTMAPRATPAEAPPPADPGKPRKVSRFSPALVVGVIAGLLFVGFTMMVALGVLMAVLGGAWLAMLQEGNVDATKLTIGKVSQALELYGAKHKGRYPSTEEGLGAASRYMTDGRVPTDAWGHPLQYFSPSIHRPGLSFEVVSLGRDGQPGGDGPDADIYSWDLD